MRENFENKYFDKLVVNPNKHEHSEKNLHESIIENVENIGGKHITDFEVAKTAKEIEIINFVLDEADKILSSYGREKHISIPLENIHILVDGGSEKYTTGNLKTGGHSTIQRSVIIDRVKSDLEFSIILFHELIHLKSYSAIQVLDNGKIEAYRSGISVRSRDGERKYLKNIEEGIVGLLTEKFYNTLIEKGAFYINREDIANNKIEISRKEEIATLNKIVDDIYGKHREQFKDRDQVLNLFINAQVNGELIKLLKLIKSTYGIDSLKAKNN